ncbi:MAG: OsmC family protein [Halodesulfurarchaeum sp.]
MTDTITSVSEGDYATENRIGDHEIDVDSAERTGPNPTATLLAAYASCYVVGLRIAARETGTPDLGRIRIDVTGERDDGGDLASIEFALEIEANLPAATRETILDRALETCHVGNALRDDLQATVRPHSA